MSDKTGLGTRKTRSKGGYMPYPNHGRQFLNSFFPHMSRLWNNLPNTTKCKNLQDFKIQLNMDIKPQKIKHNSKGSKEGNSLLTCLRICRSELMSHKFAIGQTDTPECICHSKEESTRHFLLDCFFYTVERQKLFQLVEHYIPKFAGLSKMTKLNILLYGFRTDNPDYNSLNIQITIAVQHFILKTKRFENNV